MNFELTDEQRDFKDRCRTFAREVIRPAARKHDEEESTPWEVIKEARKQGFQGLEALQRSASDPEGQMQLIAAEEMHWGCAGIALAIGGSGLAAAGIAASGTPEQIARWVPECFGSGDEVQLGAYAVTEPQAGSDVKSLKTTAKRDGDEWVLNGTKVFITNGGIADVHVVVATVDPELGTRGQASFVIEKGTPGPHPGQEGDQARDPRLAHRRGRARRLPGAGGEPARRRGEAAARSWSGRARARARARPTRWRPSRSPGRSSAPRRWGSPRPPTSGRSSTSRPRRRRHAAAQGAADPADAGRRRDRDRGGAAAGPAGRLDGPQRACR